MKNFEWYLDRYADRPEVDVRALVRACKMPLRITVGSDPKRAYLRDCRNYHSKGHGYIVASFDVDEEDDVEQLAGALTNVFLIKYKGFLE